MKLMTTSALVLGAFALASTPAFAGKMVTETVEVDISAYDLTTERGASAAIAEITEAAEQVCGANEARPGSRIISSESRICVETAIENALADYQNPSLAARYENSQY